MVNVGNQIHSHVGRWQKSLLTTHIHQKVRKRYDPHSLILTRPIVEHVVKSIQAIYIVKSSLLLARAGSLTDAYLSSYFLVLGQEEKKMKGTIRPISRQSACPKCGKKFLYIPKLGYGCIECKTHPNRFYLDLFWSGKRI